MAETRTIQTVKQPYKTSDGTVLYMSTVTTVQVDSNGKYVPNSTQTTLRQWTGSGFLGLDYKTVAVKNAGQNWNFTQDANGDYVAGANLQQTLANKNSLLNINLNNHVSNALQAPLQGVPAGTVNTNTKSSSNSAAGLPPTAGSARPDSGDPSATDKTTEQRDIPTDPVEAPEIEGKNQTANSYNPTKGARGWIYPTGLETNEQDFIKFNMLNYGRKSFQIVEGNPTFTATERTILGSVILPIQPSISDMNVVDWQNGTINPLQAGGAQIAIQGMGTGADAAVATAEELFKSVTDQNVKNYLRYWFAGQALGINNLSSRLGGAVVNPNLEMLFNGPQLRPFNFTFRLSPRSKDEAKEVRGIIRFFKQGMAVRRASNEMFLKAPNVFDIQFYNGKTGNLHDSLPRIKTCALTSCNVDYTPDGSYATFYDDSSMTSYNVTLQFNELEPIFNDEYDSYGQTTIGY